MLPFRSLTSTVVALLRADLASDPVELHLPADSEARILLTASSFFASARSEATADALALRGIRCLISSYIAEPFATHCVKHGILPIVVGESALRTLSTDAGVPQTALMTVDLRRVEIVRAAGGILGFRVDPLIRRRLLAGWADPAEVSGGT